MYVGVSSQRPGAMVKSADSLASRRSKAASKSRVAGRCQARPAKSAGSRANDGPSKAVVKHDLEDLAKVTHIKSFSSCLTNLFVPRVSSIRWQPAHAVVGLKNTARHGGVGGCVCVCVSDGYR